MSAATTPSRRRPDMRPPADSPGRAVAVKNDRSIAAEVRLAVAAHVDRELGRRAEP